LLLCAPSPIPYSLISFLVSEFLLALQQNAKVESDWCETHPQGLLPSINPKTPKKFECEEQWMVYVFVERESPLVIVETNLVILPEPRWHGFLENLV
jgi:hypothetical protein